MIWASFKSDRLNPGSSVNHLKPDAFLFLTYTLPRTGVDHTDRGQGKCLVKGRGTDYIWEKSRLGKGLGGLEVRTYSLVQAGRDRGQS